MKLGAENRTKVIAAMALGAVAVVLLAWQFSDWFGGGSSTAASTTATPSSATLPPPSVRRRGNSAARSVTGKKEPSQNLDPSLRFDVLRTSEDIKYQGTGRNIFHVFVEPPPKPIVNPVIQQQQVQQGPPPPAPPPPINLKFYGFATSAGGAKRIFLAQGEDVFIAKEGDIVDRRYKVVRISPNAVDILDVLSNNRQSIPLTQG